MQALRHLCSATKERRLLNRPLTDRSVGRPFLTAERALFLICKAEAHRRLSEPDDEGLWASLIDDFDDEMEEDGPQQIV